MYIKVGVGRAAVARRWLFGGVGGGGGGGGESGGGGGGRGQWCKSGFLVLC